MRANIFILAIVAAIITIASATTLSAAPVSKKPLIKTLTKSASRNSKYHIIKTLTNMPPLPSSIKNMTKTVTPIATTRTELTPAQSRSRIQQSKSYRRCIMMNNHARHDPRKSSWTPMVTCTPPY